MTVTPSSTRSAARAATPAAGAGEDLTSLTRYLHDAGLEIGEAIAVLAGHAEAMRALQDSLEFDPGAEVRAPLSDLADVAPDPAALTAWIDLIEVAGKACRDLQAKLELVPSDASGDLARFTAS